MAETSFEAIPQDLQMKILSRMSLKHLGKCICASKKLATIIRTKEFRDLHLQYQYMARPRMLFMVLDVNFNTNEEVLLFYSVYQDEKKPLLSSGQQESLIFQGPPGYKISQPTRGLVCVREKTKIMICNPTTKKCWTLLELKTCKEELTSAYFGYDEATDEFKVLCLTPMKSDGPSKEAKKHLVLTMRPGEESRRWITCEHHHTPVSVQGLCKEGVLYYGAKSNSKKSVIMSFNMRFEKFNVIALPEEVDISSRWKLVSYKGEIALVNDDDDLLRNGVLQIWVGKETKGMWEWEKTRIEILRWKEFAERKTIRFKGTIGTGELVFAQNYLDTERPLVFPLEKQKGSLMVLYYNEVTKDLRRFKIEREFEGLAVQTFLDHVDSPQLM
ncbi:putative F-box protein [Cardamine amara subsp. amara]|uniref:F-box protein n=1 Tax=Cardamine amara subsp. amara TaxID=228776 RepID=A0ABD1B199_CARAN